MIKNQWYAILPSKALVKGKILSVKRLNLELALFRDRDGHPACISDQCTHRGASLGLGAIRGDCIKCPFHGLEFDRDGKCTQIPANGISQIPESRFNIRRYFVREAHGILYLWYGDDDRVTDQLPFFDDHIDGTYAYSEMEDCWNTHYSRCIENQLDVVHLPFVHHNTIGRGNKTVVNGPKSKFENGVLATSANNAVDLGQAPKPAAECEIGKDIYLNFRFPNVWMNHISEKIKVIIYFAPVDDERTILYIRFYCKLSKLRAVNAAIAFFGKYANRVIERQDKRVVITQKPKASALKMGEKLIPGDGPIVLYRRLRDELQNKQ